MAKGFENKKLKLHIDDGFEYMKNHNNEFDVIITDSSDPVGKRLRCLINIITVAALIEWPCSFVM